MDPVLLMQPLPSSSTFQLVSSAHEWMQASRQNRTVTMCATSATRIPTKHTSPHGYNAIQLVRCVQNLGIYIDSDLSVTSHVTKAVLNCFAALCRLQSIHRLVSQLDLLLLVTLLIMVRLDYGSVTLAGLPGHLLDCLQSVLNAVACLVCYTRKYDHVTRLLQNLHWLRIPERIQF